MTRDLAHWEGAETRLRYQTADMTNASKVRPTRSSIDEPEGDLGYYARLQFDPILES
jgi:hypothetical protein